MKKISMLFYLACMLVGRFSFSMIQSKSPAADLLWEILQRGDEKISIVAPHGGTRTLYQQWLKEIVRLLPHARSIDLTAANIKVEDLICLAELKELEHITLNETFFSNLDQTDAKLLQKYPILDRLLNTVPDEIIIKIAEPNVDIKSIKDLIKKQQWNLKTPFIRFPSGLDKPDEVLRNLVQIFPNTKELDLTNLSVTDEGLKHCGALTNLQSLTLQRGPNSQATADGVMKMVQTLPNNLLTLNLGLWAVTDDHLDNLARFTNLRSLNLSCTSIIGHGLAHLKSMQQLTTLDLSRLRLFNQQHLSHLKPLTKLRQLQLPSRGEMDDADLLMLENLSELEDLDLSGAKISDLGLATVAKFKNLRSLRLARCKNITVKGLSNLEQLDALTSLNLSAVKLLRPINLKLPHLETLNINLCQINDEGFKDIISAVPNLKTLYMQEVSQISSTALKQISLLKNLAHVDAYEVLLTDDVPLKNTIDELNDKRLGIKYIF